MNAPTGAARVIILYTCAALAAYAGQLLPAIVGL